MTEEAGTNLFRHYKQRENRFTNGLLSILELSKKSNPELISGFFQSTLPKNVAVEELKFKVLREMKATADGEISSDEMIFLVESKIKSGTLREEQIRSHIGNLREHTQEFKRLILLTPDSSGSEYINQFTKLDPLIVHLEWKKVYDCLDNFSSKNRSLLSEIIKQYLTTIRDIIFEQDIVAVICKIAFGKRAGVYADKYLEEMKRGEWDNWHTPQKYKNLDGTGRKLILYDRKRRALTLEVEIQEVKETGEEPGYPWSNKFVSRTLIIYTTIQLVLIRLEK